MNLFSFWGTSASSPYRLFISHAWAHNDDYEGVKSLLNGDWSFSWDDLSVPFDDPVDLSRAFPKSYGTIVDQLRDRIRESDALLVIAGMYCAHRPWIQTEMEAAKQFGKPVIAVRRWGQERVPAVIAEADEEVGWRTASLIGAITRLATRSTQGINAITSLLSAPANQPQTALPPLGVVGPTAFANLASVIASQSEPAPTANAAELFASIGRYKSCFSLPWIVETPASQPGQLLANTSSRPHEYQHETSPLAVLSQLAGFREE